MRTNSSGVTEVASIRTDQEKYSEGWDRIFGKKEFVKVEDIANQATVESTQHTLKILPEYYFEIIDGNKTFEIRKNDRNYKKGDIIILNCWCPEQGFHCRQAIMAKITYITSYNQKDDYVVFSFARIQ